MIWDLLQQKQINRAEKTAGEAGSQASRTAGELELLRQQVERMGLACQAMWELLSEKHGLTQQELEARIAEIDRRDGRLDGKMAVQTLVCPGCGSAVHSKRVTCVICGTAIPRPSTFH